MNKEMNYAISLYKSLVSTSSLTNLKQSQSHHFSIFSPSSESNELYQDYLSFEKKNSSEGYPPRKNDATCKKCTKLTSAKSLQKNSESKSSDIKQAELFEKLLGEFIVFRLNKNLKESDSKYTYQRADSELKRMPDIKIQFGGEDILYLEVKAILKPFVKVSELVNREYRCYSHSATLDVGDKLKNQLNEIDRKGILQKTIYVYWYDIPCIKGVFWEFSSNVKDRYLEQESTYKRLSAPSDFDNDKKVGNDNKMYLNLFEMNDFFELFCLIVSKTKSHQVSDICN
ncbi:hypothetical protein [Thiomicrorhabdus sp. 6S3-12]|uniref:hypothetical protein n=1 Tax=Thiomicrorhabdus sp. 6S3-12 TaxID=2819681 RepID=UPI001AADC7F3|nr:hypothetical protein [Thiomicrorhabdus sp. 6S3-12]MBO1923779.1 hypothetical protein [Thiomicrorhabdus sp. 6S3-12]